MNEEQVFKCDLCNEAEFDNLQKLNVHKVHCRKKTGRLERTDRVPFGVPVQRFNAPKDDGYHYHVFNDNWRKEPGRIERARAAGYELAPHERSGDAVGTNDDGSEITGVLMRIPKELYDEDQAAKQRELDKIDEQIVGGTVTKVPHSYDPAGGTKITVDKTG